MKCLKENRQCWIHSMIFLLWLSVILLIVALCGMSVVPSTVWGASWGTDTYVDSNYVVISFHGLCSKPNIFVSEDEGVVTSSDLECKKWEDLDECKDDFVFPTDNGTLPDDEFFDKVCRTNSLKHWLGFCTIVAFFATLAAACFVTARRLADSPKRQKGATISLCLAWLFLVITFGTFSANCLPRGSYSVYARKDIDMVPGPGMDCSICVWVFVMLILPINCLVKPTDAPSSRANPSTAAQYMSREAQPTVVDGPAVQGGDHGLQV
mmetsp:Transcript_21791/g.72184  ORF Transcript_21791/g.72184 Transcript_21791/m.72184 type:complete len:266 (-) Transcript_21791:352-1149(-)